jgi:hypothetical protein
VKWPFAWKWAESPEEMVRNWTPPHSNQLRRELRQSRPPEELALIRFRAQHAGDPQPFAPLRERWEP